MNKEIENQRLIGKRELLRSVPLSYSTIWDMMRRGEFPWPIRFVMRQPNDHSG